MSNIDPRLIEIARRAETNGVRSSQRVAFLERRGASGGVGGSVADATATSKGKLQLAGHLAPHPTLGAAAPILSTTAAPQTAGFGLGTAAQAAHMLTIGSGSVFGNTRKGVYWTNEASYFDFGTAFTVQRRSTLDSNWTGREVGYHTWVNLRGSGTRDDAGFMGSWMRINDQDGGAVQEHSISSISNTTPAVVTTATAHTFAVGERVGIYDNNIGTYNNSWIVEAVTGTTVTLQGSTAAGTGTATGKIRNTPWYTGHYVSVAPRVDRSILTGGAVNADDVCCFGGNNGGIAKATDFFWMSGSGQLRTAVSGDHILPVTTINVASTANFKSSGNFVTSQGHTFNYTGKTATSFTGCTRLDATGPSTLSDGATIYRSGWFTAFNISGATDFGFIVSGDAQIGADDWSGQGGAAFDCSHAKYAYNADALRIPNNVAIKALQAAGGITSSSFKHLLSLDVNNVVRLAQDGNNVLADTPFFHARGTTGAKVQANSTNNTTTAELIALGRTSGGVQVFGSLQANPTDVRIGSFSAHAVAHYQNSAEVFRLDSSAQFQLAAGKQIYGGDGIVVKTKAGVVADLDYTTPTDGMLGINESANSLAFRSNGSWFTVSGGTSYTASTLVSAGLTLVGSGTPDSTAVLQFPASTAATGGIYFGADASQMAIFRNGANSLIAEHMHIRLSNARSLRALNAAGSAPVDLLTLTSGDAITLGDSGSNNELSFRRNNTQVFFLNTSAQAQFASGKRIGFNVDPSSAIHFASSTTNTDGIRFGDDGTPMYLYRHGTNIARFDCATSGTAGFGFNIGSVTASVGAFLNMAGTGPCLNIVRDTVGRIFLQGFTTAGVSQAAFALAAERLEMGAGGSTARDIRLKRTSTQQFSIEADSGGANTWTTAATLIFPTAGSGITFTAGGNIVTDTTNGTKLGTTATQKLGFWNATPAVQPTAVADVTGGAVADAEARTAINALLSRLRTIGIIAT